MGRGRSSTAASSDQGLAEERGGGVGLLPSQDGRNTGDNKLSVVSFISHEIAGSHTAR